MRVACGLDVEREYVCTGIDVSADLVERIAAITGGPTVSCGQKHPSMTSMCTKSAPADSRRLSSSPMCIQSAVVMPMLSRASARGALSNWGSFGHAVDLQCLFGAFSFVHDRDNGPHHPLRVVALEDVPAHIDSRRAFADRAVGHGQGVKLGQLLAAGHHDRHRT